MKFNGERHSISNIGGTSEEIGVQAPGVARILAFSSIGATTNKERNENRARRKQQENGESGHWNGTES